MLASLPLVLSAAPSSAEPSAAAPGGPVSRPGKAVLGEGDKVKLIFYERLETEDDRWKGRQGSVPRGFHQRSELSGEYVVENEHVSLPMLGRFKAAGISQDALLTDLTNAFEELIERRGYVSIIGIEHSPIYVVGLVKNPGAFKYEDRMTVLHAVALAGGVREQVAETWQRVEFGREIDRLQKSLDRAKRLMARTTVLQAERDGSQVRQEGLADLVGREKAPALIGDEAWQRKLTVLSRNAQEEVLTAAVGNARSEVRDRADRLAPLDAAIVMRTERVKNLENLAQRNVVGRPVLIQAQAELSETHDRRNQAVVANEAARARLEGAERELARYRIETRAETARAAASAKQETVEALDEGQGQLDAVKALAAYKSGSGTDSRMTYEIIRRAPTGTLVLAVSDTATLMPGDLVRLRTGEEAPATAPPASPPSVEGPQAGAQDLANGGRAVARHGTHSRAE
jgi:protein involved in polysaccharide export with SLBB domain